MRLEEVSNMFALRILSLLVVVACAVYLGFWQLLLGFVLGWLIHSYLLLQNIKAMYAVSDIQDANPIDRDGNSRE